MSTEICSTIYGFHIDSLFLYCKVSRANCATAWFANCATLRDSRGIHAAWRLFWTLLLKFGLLNNSNIPLSILSFSIRLFLPEWQLFLIKKVLVFFRRFLNQLQHYVQITQKCFFSPVSLDWLSNFANCYRVLYLHRFSNLEIDFWV